MSALNLDNQFMEHLLEVVSTTNPADYNALLYNQADGRMIDHLSHMRGNLVEWLDITSASKVLILASESGALAEAVARRAGLLVCVEADVRQVRVAEQRLGKLCISREQGVSAANQAECRRPCRIQQISGALFQQPGAINQEIYDQLKAAGLFDYIIMAAPVLEESAGNSIITADAGQLEAIRELLAADGKLLAAVDNAYGLKFFAGNADHGTGAFYAGVTGTAGNTGMSREQLVQLLEQAGFARENQKICYPYPDYRLPLAIYTEEYLPKQGELTNNLRNFDRERLWLFEEARAFDRILADRRFAEFANAYLVLAGKSSNTETANAAEARELFVKYSNDRAAGFNIRTDIRTAADAQTRVLYKKPATAADQPHINHILDCYAKLTKRYEGFEEESGILLQFNRCMQDAEGLQFEYLTGRTLEEEILLAAEEKNYGGVKDIIGRFAQMVRFHEDAKINNVDLIFKNIIVQRERDKVSWTVIDYEWTWEEEIPADFIIWRAIYYLLVDNNREDLKQLKLYAVAAVPEDLGMYEQYEIPFQRRVSDGHYALGQLYGACGGRIWDVSKMIAEQKALEAQRAVKVLQLPFTDVCGGESHRIIIDTTGKSADQLKQIMLEPAHSCCFVYLQKVSVSCQIQTNGAKINRHLYVFEQIQPQITLQLEQAAIEEVMEQGSLMVELLTSTQGMKDSPVFEAVARTLQGKESLLASGMRKIFGK